MDNLLSELSGNEGKRRLERKGARSRILPAVTKENEKA